MIYGTLDQIDQYKGLSQFIDKALEFLANNDFSKTIDGDVFMIDGDNIKATISVYETKEYNERPESHHRFLDIHYVVEGEEFIGIAPVEPDKLVEAIPERDLWFYKQKTDKILITGNRFLIVWPSDAHAPGISSGKNGKVKKCVMKVRINV